jgi:hypothetical protein
MLDLLALLTTAFWLWVEHSTSPGVLATYPERYPIGGAAIAAMLAEQYDRKQDASMATEEQRVAAIKAAALSYKCDNRRHRAQT